jgi:hypothetical protein
MEIEAKAKKPWGQPIVETNPGNRILVINERIERLSNYIPSLNLYNQIILLMGR